LFEPGTFGIGNGTEYTRLAGRTQMSAVRCFISFDFDHDEDLKNLLVGQARNPDSPFNIEDWSVKKVITEDWRAYARAQIRRAEQIIVICGEHTNTARGVGIEIGIAQAELKPYFLLLGRSGKPCQRLMAARTSDKVYDWTWPNLKALIGGAR